MGELNLFFKVTEAKIKFSCFLRNGVLMFVGRKTGCSDMFELPLLLVRKRLLILLQIVCICVHSGLGVMTCILYKLPLLLGQQCALIAYWASIKNLHFKTISTGLYKPVVYMYIVHVYMCLAVKKVN